ncbi:hypothetical protein AMECASPLE_008972 [Ameca splendens]|uniref:Uncharacterized protein n=1 Tax=Ameca splendens TaxID=208324 RepID=A0ABV0Z997_9TELE
MEGKEKSGEIKAGQSGSKLECTRLLANDHWRKAPAPPANARTSMYRQWKDGRRLKCLTILHSVNATFGDNMGTTLLGVFTE